MLARLVHERLRLLRIGHVGLDRAAADLGRHGLGLARLGAIPDDHVRARPPQLERDRTSDPARAAR